MNGFLLGEIPSITEYFYWMNERVAFDIKLNDD